MLQQGYALAQTIKYVMNRQVPIQVHIYNANIRIYSNISLRIFEYWFLCEYTILNFCTVNKVANLNDSVQNDLF